MNYKLNEIELYLKNKLKLCPPNALVDYLIIFLNEFKQDIIILNNEKKSKETNLLIVKLFYERHILNHYHFEKNKDYDSMVNYFNSFVKIENPFVNDNQIIPFDLTIKAIHKHIDNEAKSGCYIATMAYGNYDHPQVIELRKFRDDSLSKSVIGRNFIKFYYKFSPSLVEKLKHKNSINRIIRKGLNQFIKTIK